MSLAEVASVGGEPDASCTETVPPVPVVWFADDSTPHVDDPVTDIRVTNGNAAHVDTDWIDAVVEHAAQAVALLHTIDPNGLDAETITAWAKGVEQLRRQTDAAGIAVADHIDTTRPFAGNGFFTAKAWLKHTLQLSGPEAHRRIQQARLRHRTPIWDTAESSGHVGVAQTRLMATIAANPRIPTDTLTTGVRELMIDAIDVSFDQFEHLARTWETLADPIGTLERNERNRRQRNVAICQAPDGHFDIHATLTDVGGAEFLEMARAAATCPPDTTRAAPTVNFLIDQDTARTICDNDLIDPAHYRTVTSRTDRGHRIDPNAIIEISMWALIRRVITNSRSVIIDLGRRQRLFTGAARDAVMLLQPTCIWPGCDHPHTWCHADHLTSWTTRGPTDHDNGAPLCPRHNSLKEHGFTITRDHHGNWHITTPDGTQIC